MKSQSLQIHSDSRGKLVELFKSPWGQTTYVEIAPGQIRGQHLHPHTNEVFCFLSGAGFLRVSYPDCQVEYTIELFTIYHVPAGCGHEVEAVGSEPLVLTYHSDVPYDPFDPDVESWRWPKS